MTTLDTRFRKLAADRIAKYGVTVILTQKTPGAYDPATGAAAVTSAAVTLPAMVEEYSLNSNAFVTGLVQQGDKKFTMAASALSTAPRPGDTVTLYGDVYTVMNVRGLWSGEQTSVYEIQGRK